MNILFLLKSFEVGGLEVVTTTLANKFQKEGHKVVIWTFSEGKTSLVSRLDENVKLVYGVGFNLSKCNINAGKVSAEIAKLHAETEFEKYRVIQDRLFMSDFDKYMLELEENAKK